MIIKQHQVHTINKWNQIFDRVNNLQNWRHMLKLWKPAFLLLNYHFWQTRLQTPPHTLPVSAVSFWMSLCCSSLDFLEPIPPGVAVLGEGNSGSTSRAFSSPSRWAPLLRLVTEHSLCLWERLERQREKEWWEEYYKLEFFTFQVVLALILLKITKEGREVC